MSANINRLDRQEGVEQAWHGLTTVVPRIELRKCWLSKWDIERVPLWTHVTDRPYKEEPTDFDMLRCTDNGHLIGKPVGQSYGEITNAQFLDMIESAIGGTAHEIVSVGSLRNRGRIFVTIKLDQDHLRRIAKREFKDYLTAGSSHDQSSELFWMNSSICTVCDNTFSINLASVRQVVSLDEQDEETTNVRLRHSKHAVARLPSIASVIDKAIGVRAEFYNALESLASKPCDAKQAERLFTGFEASKDAEGIAQITRTRIRDELYLFAKGRGNTGSNLLDVFQAGTDYYTHSHTQSTDNQRQWESSEYGVGAKRKQSLFAMLKDPEKREACEQRGAKLMEASFQEFE